MLIKREVICLKIEAVKGQEQVPDASNDAILVSNIGFSNEGVRMVDRDNIKATLSKDQPIYAGSLKKITFDAEIKGSGTAGTPPEIGQALRACGFAERIVANTSVSYLPGSVDLDACTIYYYQDGSLRKMIGAQGTGSISAEAGSIGKVSFEFTGHDAGYADEAMVTPSYDSTVPVPLIGAQFKLGAFNAIVNALSIEFGNTLVMPGDISSADGYGPIFISDRAPTGSIDPLADLPSVKNFEQEWKDGLVTVLDTGVIGKTAGNKYQVKANVAYTEIAQGDRDGIRSHDLSFNCVGVNGDDEIEMIFT